jgi:hypothetical protein
MNIGAFFYVCNNALDPAFQGGIQWVRVSGVARYTGSFAQPPVAVPTPDPATQLLFDFSNVAPHATSVVDLSGNHYIGTVGTGVPGATVPAFVPPDSTVY